MAPRPKGLPATVHLSASQLAQRTRNQPRRSGELQGEFGRGGSRAYGSRPPARSFGSGFSRGAGGYAGRSTMRSMTRPYGGAPRSWGPSPRRLGAQGMRTFGGARPQPHPTGRPFSGDVPRPGPGGAPSWPPGRYRPPYPWPWRSWPVWPVGAGSLTVVEPPVGSRGDGSEYARWVQSTLNRVAGLHLPVSGVLDAATRDAIRDFQRSRGLPDDGFVGPDTERALVEARRSGASAGAPPPSQSAPPPSADAPAASDTPPPSDAPPGAGDEGAGKSASQAPSPELFETGSPAAAFPRSVERGKVQSAIRGGQRDPNTLTNLVFFGRHPELGGRKLRADETVLIREWQAIRADIVLPQLRGSGQGSPAPTPVGDRTVAETLWMAQRPAPGLGINLEQLLQRHQAEAGGIPVEVLLAFIRFEAGGRLFNDATAGKLNPQTGRYSPTFYELGVFQTPAGAHGCAQVNGRKVCQHRPPGQGVEGSQFGKGWYRISRTYPTADNWTDPTMQVRIGLWDLRSTGERIASEFRDLFPSQQSEWYLRMAVLYSFAVGAGWTRAFLSKYREQLRQLPESQRWDFLRGKTAFLKGYGTQPFQTKNVDEKMALAAKLRAVRQGTRP